MNRLLLCVLLLCPSLTYSQEAWLDDVPTPPAPVESVSDDVKAALDAIKAEVAELRKAINDVKVKLDEKPAPVVAMTDPSQCKCDCDCPTVDEIRAVVREELERVTVTLKSATGATRKVEVPLTTPAKAQVRALQPGETVVAINGQPVTPYTYRSQAYQAPVTQYRTPQYEMRTMNYGGQFFGAVRSSGFGTCANGRCN